MQDSITSSSTFKAGVVSFFPDLLDKVHESLQYCQGREMERFRYSYAFNMNVLQFSIKGSLCVVAITGSTKDGRE